jgi:hypothetical protein
MLLSGWLSNATMKSDCTLADFFQKKLIRLLPSYFLGMFRDLLSHYFS